MLCLRFFLFLLMLLAGFPASADRDLAPAPQSDERRVALVIGNGQYQYARGLAQPDDDARVMAAALESVGFEVMLLLDLDRDALKRAVRDFGATLSQGGVGMFYYAGHAVQADGQNYLVPVDQDVPSELYIDLHFVDIREILSAMHLAGNRLNIVVLDACRSNPYEGRWQPEGGTRGVSGGLMSVEAPFGTLIAYSTAPGQPARDDSGYTPALAAAIQVEGIKLEDVFKQVRAEVHTNIGQTPWENNSTVGDFYFSPAIGTQQPVVAAVSSVSIAPAVVSVQVEYGGEVLLDGQPVGRVSGDFGTIRLEVAPGDREIRVGEEVWQARLRPGQQASVAFIGAAPEPVLLFDFFDMTPFAARTSDALRHPIGGDFFAAIGAYMVENWEGVPPETARGRDVSVLGCEPTVAPASMILGVFDGNFGPGGGQLVVVGNEVCGAPMAGQHRFAVAISASGAPLAALSLGFGTAVPVLDIDGDGYEDVLALSHGSRNWMPYYGEIGSVVGGQWVKLQDLGAVSGTNYQETGWAYSTVYAVPGQSTFRQINYLCPRDVRRPEQCSVRSEGPAEEL